jgi:glucan phosphoethanolaminetransferase (alkaline phosphatase superfamily)
MSFLLRAKHWQVFVLTNGIPLLLAFGFIPAVLLGSPSTVTTLAGLAVVIGVCSQLCWYYAVGDYLYKRLPDTVRMPIGLFRICTVYPAVYILAVMAAFVLWIQHIFSGPVSALPFVILLIIPFHLLAMACLFFQVYFIAKTLKAVENQKDVTVSDYIGEFVLVWFFFVGIWLLQPRINKMFSEQA